MNGPDLDPQRNLVVFCDGTGNLWGERNDTNVVKLVRLCVKDKTQIVFYDPGVGTASDYPGVGIADQLRAKLRHLWGLALGRGIYENIAGAYLFLVNNHRPGDRIYLIGFSRGAFTVRSVAGMINLFGLVRPAAEPMVPSMLRAYFSRPDRRHAFADDVRANFCDAGKGRTLVHFVGVFDTVATVGGLVSADIKSDAKVAGKRFVHIRHAVSEGEYRAPYAPRLYVGGVGTLEGSDEIPSLEQRWFAGVHSDVGGSYPREESTLSDCALHWLAGEAQACGLRLTALPALPGDAQIVAAPAHDQATRGLFGPWWAIAGLQRRAPSPPAQRDRSLRLREVLGPGAVLPPLPRWWRDRHLLAAFAIAVLLMLLLHSMTARVDPAAGTSALQLFGLQLGAAWADARAWAPYRSKLAGLLWTDVALIAAYTHAGCALVVHTVRRLREWRPADVPAHRTLRRATRFGLLGAAIGDLSSNGLTAIVATGCKGLWPLLLSLATTLQVVALLTLIAVALFAAIKGQR